MRRANRHRVWLHRSPGSIAGAQRLLFSLRSPVEPAGVPAYGAQAAGGLFTPVNRGSSTGEGGLIRRGFRARSPRDETKAAIPKLEVGAVPEYQYLGGSIGGFQEQGSISDVSRALVDQLVEKIKALGADGYRPVTVSLSGGREEVYDLHGNPYAAQAIEWSALIRRDSMQWEVAADADVAISRELTDRDGLAIDHRESDGWTLVGYYCGPNSATDPDRPASEAIGESVAVYTRPIRATAPQ